MIKPLKPEIIPFVLKYDTMKPSDKCITVPTLIKDLEAWMKEHGKKVKELCYFDLMADYHYCCGLYLFFTRTALVDTNDARELFDQRIQSTIQQANRTKTKTPII